MMAEGKKPSPQLSFITSIADGQESEYGMLDSLRLGNTGCRYEEAVGCQVSPANLIPVMERHCFRSDPNFA